MPRTALPARLNLKMLDEDRALLDAIAEHYRLDASATIRFLIGKEARALGFIETPHAPAGARAPAKKKRPAAR